MQSWGLSSRFKIRDTALEPTKSGVIGLLCAALGKPRDEKHPDNHGKPSLSQLAALHMGVRVNRQGLMKKDYQTAGGIHGKDLDGKDRQYGVIKADGSDGETVLSDRYYLADADFLVGLQGDDSDESLLQELNNALAQPHWQLFLGRKAFVPSKPIRLPREDGLRLGEALETALRFDWPKDAAETKLPVVIETLPQDPLAQKRIDVPLIYSGTQWRYAVRYVKAGCLSQQEGDA
jgi:CRISPR system Cascade subunit CasD